MSTRIPLPGNMIDTLMQGVKTGTSQYTGMMHPILEREKQKQLENHFQEQLKLQKAAAGRASQTASDAHRIAQYNIAKAERENDPEKMFEYTQKWNALKDRIMAQRAANQGGGGAPNLAQDTSAQDVGGSFIPAPPQQMGSPMVQQMAPAPQQMGLPSPQQLGSAQPPNNTQPPMIDVGGSLMPLDLAQQLGAMKVPIPGLSDAMKKHEQEQKNAAALDLFKQKEKIKQQNSSGEKATKAVLTENQKALQALDNVLPEIQDIIDHPSKVYGKYDFSPTKKNAYDAKTGSIIDRLIVAQQLPKVVESIELVKQQIRRGSGESDAGYIARLKELKTLLEGQRTDKRKVLSTGKINLTDNTNDYSKMSDDELRKIAGGG